MSLANPSILPPATEVGHDLNFPTKGKKQHGKVKMGPKKKPNWKPPRKSSRKRKPTEKIRLEEEESVRDANSISTYTQPSHVKAKQNLGLPPKRKKVAKPKEPDVDAAPQQSPHVLSPPSMPSPNTMELEGSNLGAFNPPQVTTQAMNNILDPTLASVNLEKTTSNVSFSDLNLDDDQIVTVNNNSLAFGDNLYSGDVLNTPGSILPPPTPTDEQALTPSRRSTTSSGSNNNNLPAEGWGVLIDMISFKEERPKDPPIFAVQTGALEKSLGDKVLQGRGEALQVIIEGRENIREVHVLANGDSSK